MEGADHLPAGVVLQEGDGAPHKRGKLFLADVLRDGRILGSAILYDLLSKEIVREVVSLRQTRRARALGAEQRGSGTSLAVPMKQG